MTTLLRQKHKSKNKTKNKPQANESDQFICFQDFNFFYDKKQVLFDINLSFTRGKITALIGPSGCGKSTLLRNINRMNDLIDSSHHTGNLFVNGSDIFVSDVEVSLLRKNVGMVFQKSNVFSKSIYDNVVFGLRMAGVRDKKILDEVVETSLRKAYLWNEVKDDLKETALKLSGGQMQRLCIARAIANDPEIILMDEPCSALDPLATAKIEEMIRKLGKEYTIIIVTHNLQQASRISDKTAFFYMGRLIEFSNTYDMFISPKQKQTEDYITGKFG